MPSAHPILPFTAALLLVASFACCEKTPTPPRRPATPIPEATPTPVATPTPRPATPRPTPAATPRATPKPPPATPPATPVPATPPPRFSWKPTILEADRAALLAGVKGISAPGEPGAVCAFGPAAFAVVGGSDAGKDAKVMSPVVAAAHLDRGRVVALAHKGYLDAAKGTDTARFISNAIAWSAGPAQRAKVAVLGHPGLIASLKEQRYDAQPLPSSNWLGQLNFFLKVLVVDADAIEEKSFVPLATWVRSGGALVVAMTPPVWQQSHPSQKFASDFQPNRLLGAAGLYFATGAPGHTTANDSATGADMTLLALSPALDALTGQSKGQVTLDGVQIVQANATLGLATRALPAEEKSYRPRIAALQSTRGTAEFPRPDQPFEASDAVARTLLTQQLETLKNAKPEDVRAHPAAEFFPGSVPKDAPRVSDRNLSIDAAVPGWHSTGLYAAPGELIHVTVPAKAADKGLSVRIGCHTDSLLKLDTWRRAPEISRRDPIKAAKSTAANPFGGLIYIDVPGSAASLGSIPVTISGGVESPRFVLGETSLADWKSKIRNAPAPWAELETKKIILSVPSEKLRQLDDPEALMKFWDQVLDADADLLTIPHDRKRPERIVADTQISAGYMHSGYPIMTPLDKSVEHTLSLADMKNGTWGHFHELGHNHQQGDWTFDGTVEVTCNLFSLYCMETLCGKPPGQGHEAMAPAKAEAKLRTYLAMSDKFTTWKSEPFLALIMYHQLRVAFGWETYKKVFAEYRALPSDQRPKGDDEKHDQWMVRFSKAAGKNLGPFFEAWGIPTSPTARDSIKNLPAWMPADWPK